MPKLYSSTGLAVGVAEGAETEEDVGTEEEEVEEGEEEVGEGTGGDIAVVRASSVEGYLTVQGRENWWTSLPTMM